ncbi:MAG: hypothetical protein ABJE66_30600 [Deltaproteobacteria bacterium]
MLRPTPSALPPRGVAAASTQLLDALDAGDTFWVYNRDDNNDGVHAAAPAAGTLQLAALRAGRPERARVADQVPAFWRDAVQATIERLISTR